MMGLLSECRLLAILRGDDPVRLADAAAVLADSGVRALEISLSTPAGLPALRLCATALPKEVLLGAGTVLTAADAHDALAAGATFLVTPVVAPEVLTVGAPTLCGALTPTEIHTASRLGAAAVKVFPASTFGPRYLREVAAPLPNVPLVPVGGVRTEDVPAYLEAGAVAVGVGSPLLGDGASGGDLEALATRARAFVQATAR